VRQVSVQYRATARKVNGFGSQAFSAQINASQAKKTINHYSSSGGNTGLNKTSASS
jgi:hypothetical protein